MIYRYPYCESVRTSLDPLSDLVTWLEYFGANDYVVNLLTSTHKVLPADARARATQIIAHARLASTYIEQSFSGPRDVAFLPSYYAILNLIKIYILFGPRHSDLAKHRWHGATYNGYEKDSHSLLTEEVTIKKGGAIPLFYQTLTGKSVGKETTIKLRTIYPYIHDVSHEFDIASGIAPKLVGLRFSRSDSDTGSHINAIVHFSPRVPIDVVGLKKTLLGFKRYPSSAETFVSREFPRGTDPNIDHHVRRVLLYHSLDGDTLTPVSRARVWFPEELPIILAFFHMSSVVRYKPEFLASLKDSRFWPVLSTMRRHALMKFLVCFWSFTHQRTLIINQPRMELPEHDLVLP